MNETKEHILKVSFLLFLQKNFKDVTMSEIVEKTGISKGAFYHYFKSKEELFEDIINEYYLNEWVIDYNKLNKDSLQQYCKECLEMVDNMMQKVRRIFTEENDSKISINYYNLIFDAIDIMPTFKKKLLRMNESEYNSMLQAVSNARKNKEINSKMSDEKIAQIFLYITDGVGIRALMQGKLSKISEEIKNYWDSFYELLKV